MEKGFLFKISAAALLALTLLQSCDKNDDETTEEPMEPITNQSFTQSFDTRAAAESQGWKFINLSDTATGGWEFRATAYSDGFRPHSGAAMLLSDYTASNGGVAPFVEAQISNWAISPSVWMQNGDKISFWARSHGAIGYVSAGTLYQFPDRLQLRMNAYNDEDSIGATSSELGGFTTPLVDINSTYLPTAAGFPTTWTKFEATISGLNKPVKGRFAIRYFLNLQDGAHGDEVVVDDVTYTSITP